MRDVMPWAAMLVLFLGWSPAACGSPTPGLPELPQSSERPSALAAAGTSGAAGAASAQAQPEPVAAKPESAAAQRCPPDLDAPIPELICPTARESIDGKVSSTDRSRLQASQMAEEVIVMVQGGPMICTLPECPPDRTQVCPARERVIARWEAETEAAQACVRARLVELGGPAEPETFWIINAFTAMLDWPQVQGLAEHPHVRRIELSQTGTPPP